MHTRWRVAITLFRRGSAALLFVAALGNAQAGQRRFEAVEPHMGTLVRIQLYAADQQQARTAFRAAFERIAQLDAILSDYKPDSELNRLCRAPAGRPVAVSEDLFQVLGASQELAAQTDGAFDVTLGPIVRLWREARKQNILPDTAALQQAASQCGYRKLRLDPLRREVTLPHSGMQLDLGGIAKGYAADAALLRLRQLGIRSTLVAISGDIVCGDAPPGKKGWRIAADPVPAPGSANRRILELSNAAVSTSGDAEQHLDSNGRRYSHIVDPATRQGITSRIAVSVVAPAGMLTDGLATAVSLMGLERGLELIEQHADAAAVVAVSENETMRLIESPRFRSFVAAPERP